MVGGSEGHSGNRGRNARVAQLVGYILVAVYQRKCSDLARPLV